MKEQITPEKELNEMERSNLSDAEFKTLLIRMVRELSEDLISLKKIQSDTKGTLFLTEIKNKYRENNSRAGEAENQINDWEHKEAKNNQDNKKKREYKKKQG